MKTLRLHFIAILFLLQNYHWAVAQKQVHLVGGWEYLTESFGFEKFNKVITSMDGSIVAVGSLTTDGDSDGLFVVVDPATGEQLVSKKFGTENQDAFNSVIQNFDGTFTIVGYKGMDRRGHKEAWIVSVDRFGDKLFETTIGDAIANNEIIDVAVNKDGEVLSVGMDYDRTQPKIWVAPLNGRPPFGKAEIAGFELGRAHAMTTSPDGQFVIAGNTKGGDANAKSIAWVLKTSLEGGIAWGGPKFFGGQRDVFALDITSSELNGGYALTGYYDAGSKKKEEIWWLKISDAGVKLSEKLLGGAEQDIGNAIIELSEGGYAIAGSTRSHMAKAPHAVLNIVTVDAAGNKTGNEYHSIFKSTDDNLAHSILELHNGEEIILAGSSISKKGPKDAASFLGTFSYALRSFEDQSGDRDVYGSNSETELSISEVSFFDANKDQRLASGERGYFRVDLTNNSSKSLFDIRGRIFDDENASALDYWEEVRIGTLAAGKTKRMLVPVKGRDRNAQFAEININIEVQGVLETSTRASVEGTLQQPGFEPVRETTAGDYESVRKEPAPAQDAPPPFLAVSNFRFTPALNPNPGETIKLTMELENSGGSPSPVIPGRFEVPNGIVAQSSAYPNIQSIRPGERKSLSFYFAYRESFNEDNIRIIFQTERQGSTNAVSSFFNLPIQNRGGGSVPDEIFWVNPDPEEHRDRVIDVNDQEIDLKVISLSSREQRKTNFAARINGRRPQGQKMDETTLGPAQLTADKRRSQRTFSTKVYLEEGINEVEVVYLEDGLDGKVVCKSSTLTFRYIPRNKPNLHVLSIGVPHPDLEFTVKDARDFAAIYQQLGDQSNNVGFKKVSVTELLLEQETEALDLRKAFEDLRRWKIKDGDLLVIFLSTHGQVMENGDYYLVPSNFDPAYPKLTGLNFKEDVLKKLHWVDGNKLVFVDACHSGTVGAKSYDDGAASKVMNDLIRSTSGLEIFASCSDNEFSYEDSRWNNGAFTKAILEAFNNERVEVGAGEFTVADLYADNPITKREELGSDGVITIGELRRFLQRRVPFLVRSIKGELQTPTNKTAEQIGDNTGIFMINN